MATTAREPDANDGPRARASGEAGVFTAGIAVVRDAWTDDIAGSAAELAYRWVLALFPFMIFVTAASGAVAEAAGVSDPTQEVMGWIEDALPENAREVVREQLESTIGQRNPGLLSVSIVGALLVATGAVNALIKVMNRAYDVEETRPLWRRYLLAFGLTLLAGTLMVSAFFLVLVGQVAGREIAESLGVGERWSQAVSLARLPLVLLFVLVAVAFLYWATPNTKLPFRWISAGAALFVVAWLIATSLFALYITTFANINATYGALGGVAVLLIWAYISAFVLILGAEVNAMLHRRVGQGEPRAREA